MSRAFSKPMRLVFLFVLLVAATLPAISKMQGEVWLHPGVMSDSAYPTNDCGKNWGLFLDPLGNDPCAIGIIKQSEVNRRVEQKRQADKWNIANDLADGLQSATSYLDEVLAEIAKSWGH